MFPIDVDNQVESQLYPYCSHPSKEIYIIKEAFAKLVKTQGPNQWNPFVVFFDTPFKFRAVVQSRFVKGYENLITCVSEIFTLFPAMGAQSAIMVLDTTIQNEFDEPQDALKLFFVAEQSCNCVTISYTVNEDNDVLYTESDYQIDSITVDDFPEAYKDLYVIMFTYTHTNSTPYTEQEAVSYLTYCGHFVRYADDANHHPYLSFEHQI